MTPSQKSACARIIHLNAAAAAAGNAVPVPGLGWAADIITMTTMTMELASVFGADIKESVARNMAIAALKRELLRKPIKQAAKGLGKYIPFAGPAISAGVSVAMIEAAGWNLARELAEKAWARRTRQQEAC